MLRGMLARTSPLLSFLILVSCFSSCLSYGPEYREVEITGHTGAEIWRQVAGFATANGFREDSNETDIGRRIYQSRWSGESVAFRRGSRRRFHAQILPLEESPPKFLVQYYVETQHVADTSKNMQPQEHDWEFLGQDRLLEAVFLRVMQVAFNPRRGRGAPPGAAAPTGSSDRR